MSPDQCDVVIAGGGLAGNTLACLLAGAGLDCVVVEAAAENRLLVSDPRALAMTHASRSILESAGAWQTLPADRIGHFRRMHVWDENGKGEVKFDSAELCQPTLGYIVQQSQLQQGLEQATAALANVRVIYESGLQAMRWPGQGIEVELTGGECIRASLLVGADGSNSPSRELAGIRSQVHDYQQHAVACLVRTALGHEDVARQRFLGKGPLAFLPMHDEKQCGVVWSTSPEQAGELMQMDEAEFNRSLQEAFQHSLGEVQQSEQRRSFPLRRAQAEHYCMEAFVLIGDAAHSVHPLAGQGANLGLLDAASLAQLVIQAHSKKLNIASRRVLRGYERWRKVENRSMMMIFEGFKYAFENQSSPLPQVRNQALDLANSIVPLKHTIMRHAMGLAGDLPELAKRKVA